MSQDILLFGCGYALRFALSHLPRERVVLTTTTSSKADLLRSLGWTAEVVSNESEALLQAIGKKYPSLSQIVDSAPPVNRSDPAIGARRMMSALKDHTLKRFVYLSTTGVFGIEDGSVVTEKMEPKPSNPRSLARLNCEETYRKLPCEVVVLRIAGIYGPGRGIGTALKAKRYSQIDNGARWSNRIQVEDLGRAIANAVLSTQPLPPVISIADNSPAQINEVVQFYCKQFSLPDPPTISYEEAVERGLHTMLSNQRISNELLRKTVLPELRYPSYREGASTEFQPESELLPE